MNCSKLGKKNDKAVYCHSAHLTYMQISESEVAQSCSALCCPMACSLPGSSIHGIFQARSTGVGCHFLLQVIFPTQGSNSGLPHHRQMLLISELPGKPLYADYIMQNAGLDESQAGINSAGEISTISDMQMTPPLWQKAKRY